MWGYLPKPPKSVLVVWGHNLATSGGEGGVRVLLPGLFLCSAQEEKEWAESKVQGYCYCLLPVDSVGRPAGLLPDQVEVFLADDRRDRQPPPPCGYISCGALTS